VNDAGILEEMLHRLPELALGSAASLQRLLVTCMEELPVAGFYDYHALAKRLKVSPPKIDQVIGNIRKAGFPATRTHYSGTGIKSTAPLPVINSALRRNAL
jgi:tRNA (guanine26-N2/guanine27-N2)-dimethyltransferase